MCPKFHIDVLTRLVRRNWDAWAWSVRIVRGYTPAFGARSRLWGDLDIFFLRDDDAE